MSSFMSLECFVLNCNLQFEYGILWWPGPITNWKRSIDFEKVPRHFEETLSLSLPICLVVKENSAGRSCTSPKEKQHPLVSLKRRRFVTNASRALSHASSLIYYVQTDGHMFLRAASISRCLRTSFYFFLLSSPLFQNESDVHGNILFLAKFVLDSLVHWCILTRI